MLALADSSWGMGAAAAEDGGDVALFEAVPHAAVHEGEDAGELLVVFVDEGFGVVNGHLVDASCEAVWGDAVDDAEVDDFCSGALLGSDLVWVGGEDLCGDSGVDVLVVVECVDERGVFAEVGEDAQFDLRVIGADQQVVGLGDEGASDLAAELGADGDVLEVGVRRRRGRPVAGRRSGGRWRGRGVWRGRCFGQGRRGRCSGAWRSGGTRP